MVNEIYKDLYNPVTAYNNTKQYVQYIHASQFETASNYNVQTYNILQGPSGSPNTNIPVGIVSTALGATAAYIVPTPPQGSLISSITMRYTINGVARTPSGARLGFNLIQARHDVFDNGSTFVSLFTTGFQQVPSYSSSTSGHLTTAIPDYDYLTNARTVENSNYHYIIIVKEETGSGTYGNLVEDFTITYTLGLNDAAVPRTV